MKNTIVLALALAFAPSAFAAKLKSIKHLANQNLEAMSDAAENEKAISQGAYSIVKPTPPNGRTPEEVRKGTVGQAAHLVCSFFDEGVTIEKLSDNKSSAAKALADLEDNGEFDKKVKADMIAALEKAQNQKVEVFTGSASGNNTLGTVLGIYDLKNNQILVFANTNCGSDD